MDNRFISPFSQTEKNILVNCKHKGIVILLCGPNGVGKGTIASLLVEKYSGSYMQILRYTSRAQGAIEQDKNSYVFISDIDFKTKIKNGEFLEWHKWPLGYYGTEKKSIIESITQGRNAIVDLDANAALQLTHVLKQAEVCCADILLSPVDSALLRSPADLDYAAEKLIERILTRGRGEDKAEIQLRKQKAIEYLAKRDLFSFCITNPEGNPLTAAERIHTLVRER